MITISYRLIYVFKILYIFWLIFDLVLFSKTAYDTNIGIVGTMQNFNTLVNIIIDCSISVLFSTFCSKRIPIHSHMVPIIANEYAIFNLFRDFLLKFTLDDITINNTISIDSAKNVVIV